MLRHAFNHLGVVVASKVMPLASLLVYSRFLEPAEYGVVSLFVSYVWIFGIVLTLNLHVGIGRLIYDRSQDAGALVGTTLAAAGLPFALGLLGVAAALPWFAGILNLPPAAVPLLVAVSLGQVAESLLVQVLTARERSGELLAAVATRSLAALSATLLLFHLLPTDRHYAVLWAEAGTSVLLAAYLVLRLRRERPWSFSREVLRAFAGYAVPLIPYMLSLTLISQFDRVMIDRLFGKEATGLYSIGYNLGILIVMVAGALLNAANPRFFAAMDAQRHDDVRRDAQAVFTACAVMAFGLVLFGPLAASFVIPARYEEAFELIPLVALGGLASVLFQLWGRVVGYARKTWILSAIACVATVLKIALNAWLLPVLGYAGGAVTTVLAYGFMAAAVVVCANRLGLLRIGAGPETVWLALLALAVFAAHQLDVASTPMGMAWRLVALALVLGLAWKQLVPLRRLPAAHLPAAR